MRTVVSCQLSVVGGQWSVVSGRWSVVSGQWSLVVCQLSVVVVRTGSDSDWVLFVINRYLKTQSKSTVVSGRWSVVRTGSDRDWVYGRGLPSSVLEKGVDAHRGDDDRSA